MRIIRRRKATVGRLYTSKRPVYFTIHAHWARRHKIAVFTAAAAHATAVIAMVIASLIPAINNHVYALTLVTTGNSSVDVDSSTIIYNGSIDSDETIQQRGVELKASGNTTDIVVDDNLSEYSTLEQWGQYGSGNGQFGGEWNFSSGIDIDSSGYIYVADTGNHRIQKFSPDGTFITKWGTQGSSNGQLSFPSGIDIDSSGYIYVADTGNHRIQKFSPDGTFITKWGTQGSSNGQLNKPYGVAIDSEDNIYITEFDNHRVQKFDNAGNYILKWGTQGSSNGQLHSPQGIAVDSEDNIYTLEWNNSRIQKFDSVGNFLSLWSSNGSDYGAFDWPLDIVLDPNDDIYIADMYTNHRVQKLRPNGIVSGGFSVTGAAEHILQAYCGQTLQYRAYATINNQKIYGEYEPLQLPGCPPELLPPDLRLDITLNEPGLVQGQQASYIFTVANVAGGVYDAGGTQVLIVAPDGIELANPVYSEDYGGNVYTDEATYECYDTTADFETYPSFAYHLGIAYSCTFMTEELAVGQSQGLTLPFNVDVLVNEQTLMRALVMGVGGEVDIEQLYQAIEGSADIFDLEINNIATYAGTQPGSTIDQGGEGANQAILANATNGASVSLTTPSGTELTCSSPLQESSQSAQDAQYSYPLGLVDFCFTTENADNQISLTFVTQLKPDEVKARKYNSTTNTYFDIQGATITQTTYQGQPALQLTYTITDNGMLDLDPVTGQIKDPVGLAVREGSSALARTGQSRGLFVVVAVVGILGAGLYLKRRYL